MARLDLVVFGATGFTGKHAVLELTQLIKKYPGMTWGVAGRSREKLEKTLQEVSTKIDEDMTSVKTIIADVADDKSLKEMCGQARVIVNCCGPYRHYGEPVVKAAIESRTHYVDVSGEPQFMELMQLKYSVAAREAGVFVVSACGFDSIPVDLGVIFLQQHFGGTLNSVETYMSASSTVSSKHGSAVNYGTWESLIYGLAHYNDLKLLRKELYPTSLPPFKPKLKPRSVLHRRDDGWCLPFPGADASVVYRTQRALYDADHHRPAQVKTYARLPSLPAALATAFIATLLYLMSKTAFTRSLLLNYPALFTLGFITKDSPSEEVTRNTTFVVDLRGEGWPAGVDVNAEPPTRRVNARVSGVNPGYGATVVALLLSALTVLTETDKMPQGGGVMTPGVAFKDTSIVQHLNENNVKFEIV